MKKIFDTAAEFAPTNIPVLLCGESGTGKEVLARRIHGLSQYFDKPLDKIPCAWVSVGTFAERLARHSHPTDGGLSADRGTLFLDELSDLDAASQTALLHALQVGEINPSSGAIASRVISSTARDLVEETRQGTFCSELYSRLNGVSFRLPPLRERKEDIPELAQFFLAKHAAQLGLPQPSLRTKSLETLSRYPWPGNIRELENVVLRILVLGDEKLVVSELNSAFASAWTETTMAHPLSGRGSKTGIAGDRPGSDPGGVNSHALEPRTRYKSRLYKLTQIEFEESEAD